MKDEIKEILDSMKDEIEGILARLSQYVITPDVRQDFDELLDYITNLEQENESINEELNNITDYAKDLEQENRNLKFILSGHWEEEHNNAKIVSVDTYKSRIDKAVEYIKEHNCIATNKEYKPTQFEYCCNVDLLNILTGGSDE